MSLPSTHRDRHTLPWLLSLSFAKPRSSNHPESRPESSRLAITSCQSWRTFLRNLAAGIAATDLFVVPTIGFKLLYCLVALAHGRRELVYHAVTAHPTAEWVAQQMTEAFPWNIAPRYLVRDRN